MLWSRGYSWVSEDWRIIRFCEKILLYLIRAKSYTAYGTKLAVRTALSRVLFRGLLEKTSPCMQSRMGFIWLHFGRRRTLFFFFSILGKFLSDGIMVNPGCSRSLCPSHLYGMFSSLDWIPFWKLLLQRNTGSLFCHCMFSLRQLCGKELKLSQRFLSFFSFLGPYNIILGRITIRLQRGPDWCL